MILIPEIINFDETIEKYFEFLDTNKIEIWKTITRFPRYEVSNLGKIRVIATKKILKPSRRYVYCELTLVNDHERKSIKIHRIVATEFVSNKNIRINKIVDHINGKKDDNRVVNLRWCTHSENTKFYFEKSYKYKGKIIEQFDLNKNKLREWDIKEILAANQSFKYDYLLRCLTGGCVSAYGYIWEYKEKMETKFELDEIFKKIGLYEGHDFSNYEISNHGKVRNISKDYIFKMNSQPSGYYVVYLTDAGTKKGYTTRVHRLVASYFVDGKSETKNVVNHKDENKLNNYYKNLEWMTSGENTAYSCNQNKRMERNNNVQK